MYLVTAYFDDKTNRRLQNWIDRIADATGNRFMAEHHVPPHLTLTALEARSVEAILPSFAKLEEMLSMQERTEEQREFFVEFVTVGALFPFVLYTAPVLSSELQNLQGMVCDAFADLPDVTISRYYQPGSWMPHVTLGKTLERQQMQMAFARMQEVFGPVRGQIVRIGLSRVNPHEDVAILKMGKKEPI